MSPTADLGHIRLPAVLSAGPAGRHVAGLLLYEREPRYPSDLTDQQWNVLEPRAREVMVGLVVAEGKPMVHDLRAVCDAIAYVVRNGIEWRAFPVDFPPGASVSICQRGTCVGGGRAR